MIEVFASSSKEVVPECAHHRAAKKGVEDEGAQQGVAKYFDRMLVEGCKRFDTGWRVMDLMEREPPSFLVSNDMPPIKKECADEPADEAFDERKVPLGQIKQRHTAKQLDPQASRGESNQQLRAVNEQSAAIPALDPWQRSAGVKPLQDKKQQRSGND